MLMRFSLLVALLLTGIVYPAFPNEVQTVQKLLNDLGYNAGVANGVIGRKTTNALRLFYKENGSNFDGTLDGNELADLTAQNNGLYGQCSDEEVYIDINRQPSKSPLHLPKYDRVTTTVPAYARGTFGDVLGREADPWIREADLWIIAASDVNNDGITDIYIEYTETAVSPEIYLGNTNGEFTALPNPINTTRRSINMGYFKDLTNDGFADFVGFVTSDHIEYFQQEGFNNITPGEPDLVLINVDGVSFMPSDVPEAHKNDVNHGGIVSDIDNDGFLDLIPLSESEGLPTFPIRNVGGKGFELSSYPLPEIVTDHWIEDGAAGDLDGDGFDDYVISLELPVWSRPANFDLNQHLKRHKPVLIIYGDGDYDFSDNRILRVGKYWFDANTLDSFAKSRTKPSGIIYKANTISFGTSNLSLTDINGDGRLDILEGQYLQAPKWETSGFQVYLNKGGCFQLATDQLFPDQNANRIINKKQSTGYIKNFHFGDLNQDGHLDVLQQALPIRDRQSGHSASNYPYIFLGTSSGRFLPLDKSRTKQFRKVKKLVTGDFNGDGLIDIAGTHFDGTNKAKIVAFLAKPVDKLHLQKFTSNTQKLNLKWSIALSSDNYTANLEAEDIIFINARSEIIDIESANISPEGISGRDELEYVVQDKTLKIEGEITVLGGEQLYVNFSAPLDAKEVSRTFGAQDKLILTWEFKK
jgi:hypothetical protein